MDGTILAMMFLSATQSHDLPKGLLSALCFVESHHKPAAFHKDDGNSSSLGLCQIKLTTAKLLGFKGTEKDLMNPKANVEYASKYLKKQLNRYKGDYLKAVSAYNMGTYRENKHGNPINQGYISKVLVAWLKNQ